jgi:hypothetical protein
MEIEKTQVYGFESSIRAMRNPLDSWDKSDSVSHDFSKYCTVNRNFNSEGFILGENDKKLSLKLTKAGNEHCKHLRLIQVWVDLTLPRYLWQEFDTYRHIEKVSCSTMHTLMKYDIDPSMFENGFDYMSKDVINSIQYHIDEYRKSDNAEDKKRYKYIVKSLLPESFLQKRTINTNYQCLLNIYNQRKNHELPLWQEICNWIISLPYFIELTGKENELWQVI